MTVFWFLIKEGFRGLIRSNYAGAFSIIIIAISLIFIGVGYIAARDTLVMVDHIRAQYDINVFLRQGTDQPVIDQLAERLKGNPAVTEVVYVSSDSAAKLFKQEFGQDIFDILEYNPLPPAFTLRLKPAYRNLPSVEAIARQVNTEDIVDEVKYRKNFLLLLEKYQRLIFASVVTIFSLLTILSVILAGNSIKMTIFSRRDVILTMKHVGATNTFVRAPFLIEGTLEGLVGALLAGLTIWVSFHFLNTYFQTIFQYKALASYRFYGGLAGLGSMIGLIGSMRAIRKFLI